MDDQTATTHRVLERYKTRMHAPFPTADINKLFPDDDAATNLLHARLEMYLSGIAGYASTADRLARRSREDLKAARLFLLQSFFERFREYSPLRAKINRENAPPSLSSWRTRNLLGGTCWRKSSDC